MSTMPVPLPSFRNTGPDFGLAGRSGGSVTEMPRDSTMISRLVAASAGRKTSRIAK
ncbi:MAG TPA: hypothetical protein VIU14_00085 [Mesorhizobium sp.]